MPYTETHPWITFELNTERLSSKVWLLLGQVRAQCDHLANIPVMRETRDELLQMYLAKGAHATTQIEGNTLTEEQVLLAIRGELEVPPSQEYLRQEVLNIHIAYVAVMNALMKLQDGKRISLNVELINMYNRVIMSDLDLEDGVVPGEIRTYSVGVPGYRGALAEDCRMLLGKMCDWLNGLRDVSDPEEEELAAILAAILSHLYSAWIHPYGDGNGRTARLLEFQILVEAGVPIIAAHVLSDHYNKTRTEYYRQLQRASDSGGNVVPFLEYALQGFSDGLAEQLQTISEEQMDIAWQHHVYEAFKTKPVSLTMTRRRHLVLDMSAHAAPVAMSDIPQISARLAKAYATRTLKTVTRDVHFVEEMGLVERTPRGVRVCREIVRGFLPAKRDPHAIESEATA